MIVCILFNVFVVYDFDSECMLFSDFVVYASECMYVMILSCMLVSVYYLVMLHVCVV